MRAMIAAALFIVAVLGALPVHADSHERMVVVWTCELAEGKTAEDVQATNSKWVKLVNAGLEEGEIRSYVLTTVVGDLQTFLYVDSFPSGEAWLATRTTMESDEGKALEAEFDALGDCSSNSLYASEQSLPAD